MVEQQLSDEGSHSAKRHAADLPAVPHAAHDKRRADHDEIANIEDESYVDADGKVFANTAPVKDITMTPRDQYGRHTFVGANVFVLERFRQFGVQLGLTQGDPNYDTNTFSFVPRLDLAIKETTQQVQSKTATVTIRGQRRSTNGLEVDAIASATRFAQPW